MGRLLVGGAEVDVGAGVGVYLSQLSVADFLVTDGGTAGLLVVLAFPEAAEAPKAVPNAVATTEETSNTAGLAVEASTFLLSTSFLGFSFSGAGSVGLLAGSWASIGFDEVALTDVVGKPVVVVVGLEVVVVDGSTGSIGFSLVVVDDALVDSTGAAVLVVVVAAASVVAAGASFFASKVEGFWSSRPSSGEAALSSFFSSSFPLSCSGSFSFSFSLDGATVVVVTATELDVVVSSLSPARL